MSATHSKAQGEGISDEAVEAMADEAERGYDVEELLQRRSGRHTVGSAAASVESVRLDAELKRDLLARGSGRQERFRAYSCCRTPVPSGRLSLFAGRIGAPENGRPSAGVRVSPEQYRQPCAALPATPPRPRDGPAGPRRAKAHPVRLAQRATLTARPRRATAATAVRGVLP
jgi:hypothetical protein